MNSRTLSVGELRRRAHGKLAERIDPARTRHKPLSILRAEARRIVEAYLDQEAALTRADRDKLAEDVLAEAVGVGPLEELFRDESIKEIIVVAPAVIVSRKSDDWMPTSARFRDLEQYRQVIARWMEVGESFSGGAAGGFDVRLGNGFRALGVLPPPVLDLSPQVLLVRGVAVPPMPGSGPVNPFPLSGSGSIAGSGSVPRPAARPTPAVVPIPPAPPPPVAVVPVPPPAAPDPNARLRQRVSERIVTKFAAAGVYDLNQIPLPELRRIIAAHVEEVSNQDRLGFDEIMCDRLALEILANMSR